MKFLCECFKSEVSGIKSEFATSKCHCIIAGLMNANFLIYSSIKSPINVAKMN